MIKKISCAGVLFFSFAFLTGEVCAKKTVSAPEQIPEELKILAKKGLDNIYGVRIDEASEYFNEALKKYPDHPISRFGIAMVTWARLEYLEDESNPELEKLYAVQTDEAIETGKLWLKNHPNDSLAHMCMGGMYGLRARLAVLQHRWLKAYSSGKKALKSMHRTLEIDPEAYDAYLGLGMYEYYAGTLRGVVKILAKLVMSGNAEKGIKMLNLCREKGYYNSTAAKLLLVEIYTKTGSRYADPVTAVKWAREFREQFPHHAQMHFVQIVSLYENKQYDESLAQSLDYLSHVNDKNDDIYKERYRSRICTAIGTNYLVKGDYENAEKYFSMSRDTIKTDKTPARWAVWGIVRLGNLYDLRGERDKALKYYKEARSYGNGWGFFESIDHYIKHPFTKEQLPGALPPP